MLDVRGAGAEEFFGLDVGDQLILEAVDDEEGRLDLGDHVDVDEPVLDELGEQSAWD